MFFNSEIKRARNMCETFLITLITINREYNYIFRIIFFSPRIKKKSLKVKEILAKDTKKPSLINHLKVQTQQRQQ